MDDIWILYWINDIQTFLPTMSFKCNLNDIQNNRIQVLSMGEILYTKFGLHLDDIQAIF